jgi:1L-myo-inositol 1-phosphate cytidylyltransferase / CDP-L-myo-inositol myo-inositolphosphotransferase
MQDDARQVLITAEPETALVHVCGISLLERMLRILQRLEVREATILSANADLIRAHLAQPSWARSAIAVTIAEVQDEKSVEGAARSLLLLDAGGYLDPRLIDALLRCETATLLVDSAPPLLGQAYGTAAGYYCGAGAIERERLRGCDPRRSIHEQLTAQQIGVINVADQPTYLPNLRRDLRPVWFPAPSAAEIGKAERLILDAAQNGTLDLPAIAHGPIETAIVRRLCRTRITPMQITLFTAAVSALVTWLFASGQLLLGTWLALIVGVLDGLDGKQARVKVETTELGKREHVLDYTLELSWWTALAYHFASTRALPHAYALLLLLVGSDLVGRYGKKIAKQRTGRNLDDVAPVDRFVRLIGGRRNIYIWMLAAGVALGAADKAFALLCYWGAGTAAIHLLRGLSIARQPRTA